MSEWRETNFGEVIDVINGFAFKSSNFLENMVTNSLPIIKIKNVANGNVHLNGVQYHAYSENLSKYIVKKGDVLIALTGNHPQAETQIVGLASRYKVDRTALINQRVAKVISKNEETLSTDYIFYFLKDTNTHLYLASRSSGSANQANISKSDIENIPFSLPPKNEQKAIAAILSSLDDKIDLLHRQNKTLEAMAETLFRQWFVEEASVDWEEKPLGELLTITSSKRIFYSEYVATGVPFYRSKEIIELHNTGNTKSELCISANRFNEIQEKFGVPITGDILLTSVGTLGIPYRVKKNDKFYFKDGNLTWFKDFTSIPSIIIYCWLKSGIGKEQLDSITIGSTQAALTINGLKDIKLIIPPEDRIQALEENLIFFYNKLDTNQVQIQTLETLRDNLLPKLMSGAVRVNL